MEPDSPDRISPAGASEEELVALSDELLAWGSQHRVLLRPLYKDERGVYPEVIESAEGCEVVDVRGRRFIDWTGAWGPVMLGYRHPAVESAIKAQLEAGPLLPLMHRIELEVAALIVEMVPCAEKVAFAKNGSDVTTAAVRIARAETGRQLILQWGFHGFHDWYTSLYRTKNVKGISPVLRAFIHSFDYNDLDSLRRLFNRYPDEVAAVIMEPVQNVLPDPGFLEGVRDLAHRNGALLIFDELFTGFRLANGGAQEYFGVVPDLACFGKALGNGMPLTAVAGKSDYMKHLPDTAWGMTARGETLSLAAARAVLQTLRDEPVTEHLAAVGAKLRAGFQRACEERGIGAELLGPDARMAVEFHGHGLLSPDALRTYFLRQCATNGVLSNGMVLPSFAHDDAAVDRTLEAFERSLDSVFKLFDAGRVAVSEAIRTGFANSSAASQPMPTVPGGWLDRVQVADGKLVVEGWVLGEQGPFETIELVAPDGDAYSAQRTERADLADVFPNVPQATEGGYSANLPAPAFAQEGGHEFTVVARQNGSAVFRCRVVRSNESSSAFPAVRWSGEALHI